MRLKGKKIAYLVGPGFEDLEFWVPLMPPGRGRSSRGRIERGQKHRQTVAASLRRRQVRQ
jgi:hypothetical protein